MGEGIVKQFDSVVGQTHLKFLQDVMSSQYFAWYLHPDINYGSNDKDPTKLGFVHTFIREGSNQSDYANHVAPIVWKAIDETGQILTQIIRVKANMTLNMSGIESPIPHQDREPNCDPNWKLWSAIFYPFDVDGDTVFYADDRATEIKRITPKANSMVLFDSMVFHHGFLPRLATNRKIINIAFATV
jgi:hypothetical protein